ncbi:cell division control protein Cdc31, putative [Paecilomyces variotii No. 5]|uniref:Cell division control protein Cdc31, putative n=1 Tax=Byssochlamys spectabilis (strain No. 5 / NBRC 109023) TaxID=1356009 RepID=V5G0T7_BYSSN|nr:cell division control protein Cdc31, putative [Paecilomyces variotii No. 5]
MASAPFGSRSAYAGGKLPDRSLNANPIPFGASSFSRHRGLGGAVAGEFGPEGAKSTQQPPAPPAHSQTQSQDSNPLNRLTEEQREEINEAVSGLVCVLLFSAMATAVLVMSWATTTTPPRSTGFTLFDLDRDRHLDYHELRVALRALGFTLPKQELITLLTTYGVPRPQVQQQNSAQNQSQSASSKSAAPLTNPQHPSALLMPLSAFQVVTAHKILERDPREEILRAFELFDEGGKGYIDLEDLRRVARELGETGLEEEELRAMIEEFDLEGVGGVTREGFVSICWQ